jgi:putative tricarboxylic transport membrane protein
VSAGRALAAAALAAALLACHRPDASARAHGFQPGRPIEAVVHTGPGGGNDVLARAVAVMLQRERLLPVRMRVVNKPGGNGNVAVAYLASKRGDPNTIGFFTSSMLVSYLVSPEATVTIRDLTPIARLVVEPTVIVVRADSPYRSLAELLDAARAHPGALRQSGGSITSRDNVVRQLLQQRTGARWAFISFPGGGERIAALLGGHVDLMIIEPEEVTEHLRAGKLRLLAQVSDRRLPGLPDVPTLTEAGFEIPAMPQVRGVVAPPGIPEENVRYWQDVFQRLTRTESWKRFLVEKHFEDGYQQGPELLTFLDEFNERTRGVLARAGVKTVR